MMYNDEAIIKNKYGKISKYCLELTISESGMANTFYSSNHALNKRFLKSIETVGRLKKKIDRSTCYFVRLLFFDSHTRLFIALILQDVFVLQTM